MGLEKELFGPEVAKQAETPIPVKCLSTIVENRLKRILDSRQPITDNDVETLRLAIDYLKLAETSGVGSLR